ncbi:MAG: exodeoxyribonuclease III [Pyrinomonadaceae bacterium]
MKIATWNVNSVMARLPLVLQWADLRRPDVICLQETKCIDDKFPRAQFEELGYRVEAFGQRTYNGVAILSRLPIENVTRNFPDSPAENQQSRLIAATVAGVRVVNVYVPNGAFVGSDKYQFKLEWMKSLRKFFDVGYKPDEQVLLCGDFNVAPEDRDVYDPDFWRGRILFSEPEKSALAEMAAWGLVDSFRIFNQEKGRYSWWDYRAGAFRRDAGLRIDHIWITNALAKACTGVVIDKEPRGWERPSDHTPVIAEFDLF